ncbi:MAG: putative sulfate exporter family transporter [Gemmatimonadaceae bacterium]
MIPSVRPAMYSLAPGLALTGGIGIAAWAFLRALNATMPRLAIDTVALAILVGIVLRAFWTPGDRTAPGISFAAKQLLEVAIVLLGFATDARFMVRAGLPLVAGIVTITILALGAGIMWGHIFGLASSHALLVAAGNAICGNSAIAAVASVTGAPKEETASSIAYTAILSLALVLVLPFARSWFELSDVHYGIATGLTVYAVPQVLAAAYPVSTLAGQVGTMVKLVRVLMLAPLVTLVALRARRRDQASVHPGRRVALVPWYVIAFLAVAVARSFGLIPPPLAEGAQWTSHWLTVLAMAALGLGVEMRLLRAVGWRTAATATVSLLTLCAFAGALISIIPNERP